MYAFSSKVSYDRRIGVSELIEVISYAIDYFRLDAELRIWSKIPSGELGLQRAFTAIQA